MSIPLTATCTVSLQWCHLAYASGVITCGREITCNEGVRIFLKSLEKGGAQQDTVAAVTHMLFTVTNPSSPASANIEESIVDPAVIHEIQTTWQKLKQRV